MVTYQNYEIGQIYLATILDRVRLETSHVLYS